MSESVFVRGLSRPSPFPLFLFCTWITSIDNHVVVDDDDDDADDDSSSNSNSHDNDDKRLIFRFHFIFCLD